MNHRSSYLNYIEYSSQKECGQSDYEKGVEMPRFSHDDGGKYKHRIKLPDPKSCVPPHNEFHRLVAARSCLRQYDDTPIELSELSFILWCADGIKEIKPDQRTKRTVPSAGCRHPFDLYVAINRVKSVENGLYYHYAYENELCKVKSVDKGFLGDLNKNCLDQDFVGKAAAIIFLTCEPYKTEWLYERRSYRYLFMEAGHIFQNLSLACEAVGCGACMIGSYDDESLHQLLELTDNRKVVYIAPMGKRSNLTLT